MAACINGVTIQFLVSQAFDLQRGPPSIAILLLMQSCCGQVKGRFGLIDYEKAFCQDLKSGDNIFDQRGIDRSAGCIVVVRPDQFVANVLPLDEILQA
jgi:hypothetical protein